MDDELTPEQLEQLIDQGAKLHILDVRKALDREEVDYPIAGSEWRDPEELDTWSGQLDRSVDLVLYCVHGHQVSQTARDALVRQGFNARIIHGGIEGWQQYIRSRRSAGSNGKS